MTSQAYNAYQDLSSSRPVLEITKPDKFYKTNVHSSLQSLDSCIAAQRVELSEQNKIQLATSYMCG